VLLRRCCSLHAMDEELPPPPSSPAPLSSATFGGSARGSIDRRHTSNGSRTYRSALYNGHARGKGEFEQSHNFMTYTWAKLPEHGQTTPFVASGESLDAGGRTARGPVLGSRAGSHVSTGAILDNDEKPPLSSLRRSGATNCCCLYGCIALMASCVFLGLSVWILFQWGVFDARDILCNRTDTGWLSSFCSDNTANATFQADTGGVSPNCSEKAGLGCPQTDPGPPLAPQQSPLDTSSTMVSSSGRRTHQTHYDCTAHHDTGLLDWTEDQQIWCCLHARSGCHLRGSSPPLEDAPRSATA